MTELLFMLLEYRRFCEIKKQVFVVQFTLEEWKGTLDLGRFFPVTFGYLKKTRSDSHVAVI